MSAVHFSSDFALLDFRDDSVMPVGHVNDLYIARLESVPSAILGTLQGLIDVEDVQFCDRAEMDLRAPVLCIHTSLCRQDSSLHLHS